MNKKLVIIIVAALVVLAGGGAAVYFLFFATPAEPAPPPTYVYQPGDYFVTNIKDSKALLKITVFLVVDDEKKVVYMTEHNYMIRDVIVGLLRVKTEPELRADDILDVLREDITNTLRDELNMNYLVTVYFNDYVLQ